MDGIGAEVDGTARLDEVVEADPALRGEVEDAGIGVGTVVLRVVGRATEGGIFVVGPEQASGGLSPIGKSFGSGDVPAQDDGGDGGTGKSSADGVRRGAGLGSSGRIGAEGPLELRREGLPVGEDLDGILEAAAQRAVAEERRENLAAWTPAEMKWKLPRFSVRPLPPWTRTPYSMWCGPERSVWSGLASPAWAEASLEALSRSARAQLSPIRAWRWVKMRLWVDAFMLHAGDRRKPPVKAADLVRVGPLDYWATCASSISKLE